MEKQKKLLIILTALLSVSAIALVVVSLATDHWVESKPVTLPSSFNITTTGEEIDQDYEDNNANFGIFKGRKNLNGGFGYRPESIKVSCSASEGVCLLYSDDPQYDSASDYIDKLMTNRTGELWEYGLFNYGMWVTTIVSASLSIVFGLVSVGFAIFNVVGKPIETITGPMGLYLWNGMAFCFGLLEMVMFLVLFLTTFKKNFISTATEVGKFDIDGHTNMGYSFYLVCGATALYLANLIMLVCAGYKCRCSFSGEAEKAVDNGMILY